jgi:hypothetical protein
MIQRRNDLRFAVEALLHLGVGGEMRRENFDRDRAVQARVGRFVDLAHPARTQRRYDFVGPEPGTGLD